MAATCRATLLKNTGVKEISWRAGKWGGVIMSVRGAAGFREAALNHSCLFPFFVSLLWSAQIVGAASGLLSAEFDFPFPVCLPST